MIMENAAVSSKLLFNAGIISASSLLAYLDLDEETFMLFAILLFIDYITGVLKAHSLNHSITSNKMKYGMISKLSLILIPVVLAIAAKALGADFHYVLLVGMNILILSELYSIIGNIYSIRTKQELPEYDAVAMLGKYIRKLLIKNIEEDK